MKIIQEGSLAENKIHRGMCIKCRIIVEFEGREAKKSKYQPVVMVDCPTCKATIYADA